MITSATNDLCLESDLNMSNESCLNIRPWGNSKSGRSLVICSSTARFPFLGVAYISPKPSKAAWHLSSSYHPQTAHTSALFSIKIRAAYIYCLPLYRFHQQSIIFPSRKHKPRLPEAPLMRLSLTQAIQHATPQRGDHGTS